MAWIVGHKCKPRLHLLITDNDEPSNLDHPNVKPPACVDDTTPLPQINFNALSGMSTAETFYLCNHIRHHRIIILGNSGSIHNFILSRCRYRIAVPPQLINNLYPL
ncbi:hypothetical protein HKD37_01G000256 [Glycine soja]